MRYIAEEMQENPILVGFRRWGRLQRSLRPINGRVGLSTRRKNPTPLSAFETTSFDPSPLRRFCNRHL